MEIAFNFDKKELTVVGPCNFTNLHKRLKKMLGDELLQWDIVGETKWLHQYWPVLPYVEPYRITWGTISGTTTGPYEITYGSETVVDSILCISDEDETHP